MKDPNANADFRFRAQLYLDDPGQSFSMPCEIILPQKIGDRPQIYFFPEESISTFYTPFLLKLRGQLGEGIGSTKIQASGVGFGAASERYWGDGLNVRQIVGYAETLQITREIPSDESFVRAAFYITDSLLLAPFDLITQSYDGTVTNHRGQSTQVNLEDTKFIFENEYKYRKIGNETISWRTLVARANVNFESFDKDKLLSALDDFLLLVSFAERRRSSCLEIVWQTATDLIHEYRLNRVVPPQKENHCHNECLLYDQKQIEQYFSSAFKNLREHPQSKLIHGAVAAATLFDEGTIGTKFIRMFSALESLVLAYRRTQNLEFSVGNSEDRKNLEKSIKKAIKDNPILQNDPVRQKFLYDNIPGLFRISLRQAAERFFESRGIYTKDIWPVFDSETGIPLVQIRNKIAHGESFSREEWWHISKAEESLRLLVSRCLFSVLGTPYSNTRVHPIFEDEPIWKDARQLLSKN